MRAGRVASLALFIDESVRDKCLTVAGFVVAVERFSSVVARWRSLKERLGLESGDELKWTLDDRISDKLWRSGWDRAKREAEILSVIGQMPISAMADGLVDCRPEPNGQRPRRGPVDLYRHGLQWLLVRQWNMATGGKLPGPHLVVVDMPPRVKDDRELRRDPRWQWLLQKDTIAWATYRQLYLKGLQSKALGATGTAGGTVIPPFSYVGFAPSLFASHGKYDDLVQIADCLAGCVSEFFDCVLKGKNLEVARPFENLRQLAPVIRGYHRRDMWGFGLALFPHIAKGRRLVRELCHHDWMYEGRTA